MSVAGAAGWPAPRAWYTARVTAADLPAVFRDYFAGLEEQVYVDGPDHPFHRCFGCGPGHPSGLRVRCFVADGSVVSPVLIPALYEGPRGAVQGGIVATYLDEILGAAVVRATGRPAVTGELTVRYLRPVPPEMPLLGHGRLVTDHGKYVDVEGRLETFAGGEVLATARGRFFPMPPERLAAR